MEKKIAPLSQTYLGIYFDCLNMQESGAYNRHFLFTSDDEIDLYRLVAAIEKAVSTHPAINVRIVERNGEPFQKFSAEDYHQTVAEMSEAAWKKKIVKTRC